MNPLIFGKNSRENVVGIEIQDSTAELFIEKDGIVTSEFVDNKYWLLSPIPHGSGWSRLKGDLHYKYGKQFSSRAEFEETRGYLSRKDVYSIWDPKESFMVLKGYTYYKNMKPSNVSVLSFDIETSGLKHSPDARIFIISNTFRRNGEIIRKLFCHDEYENDGDMLVAWCDWLRNTNPSLLIGHNILGYDLPYMSYVASLYGKQLYLGRDDSAIRYNRKESKFRVDGNRDLHYKKAFVYGREIIDTMFLAYKYDISRKYESYGLKPIIKAENLEIAGRQHYDAATIKDNYNIPEEWEKIKLYAIHDADDALALLDKMWPPFFYMTQSIPKSAQLVTESATGSQFNSMMVRAYLQDGYSIPKADETRKFEGGISLGIPGIYKNALKLDVKSMYPSIILQHKLYNPKKDPKAYFLEIMKYFTEQRLENKRIAEETGDKYYTNLEQAGKILINSGFGFKGAPGLNFNSMDIAEYITREGRSIISQCVKWASSKDIQEFSNEN